MDYSLDISNLLANYESGTLTPVRVVEDVLAHIEGTRDSNAWIRVLSREEIEPYLRAIEGRTEGELPLYGIPFAIKDNIDLAGIPTTAGCPDYAYTPEQSAQVVEQLIAAGAIPIGKTNLDQFATGLVGTRSPYGPGRNAFDPAYISGGSSAGSAIAVANGSVSFALGTDTAGSGRVPAAFNNLVGLKPTKGLLSTRGVVPACRSLDCVSVFALNAADAESVLKAAEGFDGKDAFSRKQPASTSAHTIPLQGFRFGVPRKEQLQFFGSREREQLFANAVERLQQLGGEPIEIDYQPFHEAALLLYEGPWVAERYAAIQAFIESHPEALHPITRAIIEKGGAAKAVDTFKAQYRLAELKRLADDVWNSVDCVLTPTAGAIYTIDEVAADPIRLNSNLGYYTNFMNLLDYAAVSIPAGFETNGLPFGVTLFAPAFLDRALLLVGDALHRTADVTMGATGFTIPQKIPLPVASREETRRVKVMVCGAHMSGLSLNHQLTDRGGHLLARTKTAPLYRFYALSGPSQGRPGLVRVSENGASIECEVWELPEAMYGSFVAGIPAPLGIGTVELEDGSHVQGFLCEAYAVEGAEEITATGSWLKYLRDGLFKLRSQ